VHPNFRLTFTVLHGVISQNADLFITTAVRTSNSTGTYLAFPAFIFVPACLGAVFFSAVNYCYDDRTEFGSICYLGPSKDVF
jgi:hypothetical protein